MLYQPPTGRYNKSTGKTTLLKRCVAIGLFKVLFQMINAPAVWGTFGLDVITSAKRPPFTVEGDKLKEW
ncbi:hypothetical protein [Spirosoma sp. 48-14]|uniref:hypothetical protein n=1 Tax=Spirosoma sp. 48-14 TaxID=1895854 RepID=UPI0025D45089|nr:hypothetical protein [Spirosoma sp. 48-14]